MNIHDIFPEIYKQVNEDKNTFTPEIVVKNIHDSPFFEHIKDKVSMIKAKADNHDPRTENPSDIIRRLIYEGFLYHGSPSSAMEDFKYLEFQERSEPKDTNVFIHNYVNKLAKEKHGVNVRNGMFVTTQVKSAKSYGAPYLIFPLGEYKIFYSQGVLDFTDEFSTANHGEFGAHFTSYIIGNLASDMEDNKTFTDNIDDSSNGFFSHVADVLGDEQFKTFKAFKQRMVEEIEDKLKDSMSVPENYQRVLNSIKRTLGMILNDYIDGMNSYVDKIEYTQNPQELKRFEGMIFFKNAYAILMDSEFMIDVFLELIELI